MPEHTVEQPVYVIYIDAARAVSLIDEAVRRNHPGEDDDRMWQTFRDASGLGGLKEVVVSGGFDGKMWRDEVFLAAPSPRKGLLKLLEGEAITPETLAAIPASATWLRAIHLDPAATVDALRELVREVDPWQAEDADANWMRMNEELGLDLRADLLEPLGDKWLLFSDPSLGTEFGGNLPGVALVSPLDEADEVRSAMVKIEARIDKELRRNQSPLRFNTLDTGEVEVHSFTTPVVSPAWLIAEGRLVVALSPNAAMTVHTLAGGEGGEGSIVDSAAYEAVAAKLPVKEGEGKLMGLMVADLKRTALPMYTGFRALATLAQSAVEENGVEGGEGGVDVTQLLPPLNTLLPHLGPAGQTMRVDESGVRIEMIQPFPGSVLLSPDAVFSGNAAVAPMLLGVVGRVVPSQTIIVRPPVAAMPDSPELAAARESAVRVQMASDLRTIGMGMMLYTKRHKGQFPPPIAPFIQSGQVSPGNFIDPRLNLQEARETLLAVGEMDAAALERWVRQEGVYVLVPDVKNDADPSTAIVFQKPETSRSDSILVLWGDTHVTRETISDATEILKKQTGQTLAELVKEFESGGARSDDEVEAEDEAAARREMQREIVTTEKTIEVTLPQPIER